MTIWPSFALSVLSLLYINVTTPLVLYRTSRCVLTLSEQPIRTSLEIRLGHYSRFHFNLYLRPGSSPREQRWERYYEPLLIALSALEKGSLNYLYYHHNTKFNASVLCCVSEWHINRSHVKNQSVLVLLFCI